jgi:hypothetical protein
VRAAVLLEPIPFGSGPASWLPLTLPGGRAVEYRLQGGALIRTERTAGAVLRVETFRLPPGVAVRWEVEPQGDWTVVGLVLDPLGGPAAAGIPTGYRIEAVLGRDHRFVRGEG